MSKDIIDTVIGQYEYQRELCIDVIEMQDYMICDLGDVIKKYLPLAIDNIKDRCEIHKLSLLLDRIERINTNIINLRNIRLSAEDESKIGSLSLNIVIKDIVEK